MGFVAENIGCIGPNSLQSCLTLCNPMNGSPSVHRIFQARILERVAIPLSRGFITFAKTVSSIPQDAIGSGRDQGNCDVDELPTSQIIEEAKSLNSFQIFLLPINRTVKVWVCFNLWEMMGSEASERNSSQGLPYFRCYPRTEGGP